MGVPGRATAVLVTLHGADGSGAGPVRNVTLRLTGPASAAAGPPPVYVQTTVLVRGKHDGKLIKGTVQ